MLRFLSALFLLGSMTIFVTGVVQFFWTRKDVRFTRRILRATAQLIGAIAALEVSYACMTGRVLVPSTLLTDIMQAFSLDAGYGQIIQRRWSIFPFHWLNALIPFYTMLIYSMAPVVGGAVIYEVLAGVSPSIQMARSRRRELYIFSELNVRSVILAEDIAATRGKDRSYAIVFTDAYVDDEQEDDNELLMRARAIKAICLQDDILHSASFNKSKKCYFFLMDAGEQDDFDDGKNLTTLYGLLNIGGRLYADTDHSRTIDDAAWNRETGCHIFAFSNNQETIENIRALMARFTEQVNPAAKDRTPPYGDVTIKVIRDYAQTACFLLQDMPLFRPLENRPDAPETKLDGKKVLRVAIIGNNDFSREMFKTVYWCGQLLDVQLCITVVYKKDPTRTGTRTTFEDYLDRVSPELLASCHPAGVPGRNDPECLRIRHGRNVFGEPYARVDFIEADIFNTDIRNFLSDNTRRYLYGNSGEARYRLADCDYFIIMGEKDKDNLALADSIRSCLSYLRLHTNKGYRTPESEQIIAFALRNDELMHIVRNRFRENTASFRSENALETVPVMHPFGNLRERFSWRIVSMNEEFLAQHADAAASGAEHGFADKTVMADDIYDTWAGVGRSFHLPSKLLCARTAAGVPRRRFRGEVLTDREQRLLDHVEEAMQYRELIEGDHILFERLTWLEHRRWTAFIRAQGFTKPFLTMDEVLRTMPTETAKALCGERTAPELRDVCTPAPDGSLPRIYGFKDIPSRLHPCLVESTPAPDPDYYDMLDIISAARICIDPKKKDTKVYDRPAGKYLPAISDEERELWIRKKQAAGGDPRKEMDAYLEARKKKA